MRLLLIFTLFTFASCSSSVPDECYDEVSGDVEWFVAALLDRRVKTVIKHFQKTGTQKPVQESLKLFKREAEFYEIWNTRSTQDYSIYEDGGAIVAEASLPSGKILKMLWIDNSWYFKSFGFQE